jgi:hypothetical protein
MAEGRVEQVAVDFIGADDQPMAQADTGQPLEFLLGVNSTYRVVGIAEDKDFGPIGNRLLEGVEVDLVGIASWDQRRIDQGPPMEDGVFHKMVINRGLNQDALSGIGEG